MFTPEEQREHRHLMTAKLRDGTFVQGQYRLRNKDDSRCCLAVGCDVFKEVTGLGEWELDTDGWYFVVGLESDDTDMPMLVAEWYGFASRFGKFEENGPNSLTLMNDEEMATYGQIADTIDAEPHGLILKPGERVGSIEHVE